MGLFCELRVLDELGVFLRGKCFVVEVRFGGYHRRCWCLPDSQPPGVGGGWFGGGRFGVGRFGGGHFGGGHLPAARLLCSWQHYFLIGLAGTTGATRASRNLS